MKPLPASNWMKLAVRLRNAPSRHYMTQATARKSVTSLSTATASHQQQQLNAQKRASAVDLISGGVQFARASSHDSHHGSQSEFSRSVLVYTLFGATLLGGSLGMYFFSGGSPPETKKTMVRVAPPTASVSAPKVDDDAADDEAAVATEEEEKEESSSDATEDNAESSAADATDATQPAVEVEEETSASAAVAVSALEEEVVKSVQEKFLPDIPTHAQYLIVGGGTAAMSAFKAIRANDPTAKVLIVTEEKYKPYMRPPLSKDLWSTQSEELISQLKFKQYNGNERSLYYLEDEFYVNAKYLNEQENGGVGVVTQRRVVQIDTQSKTAKLDNNWEIAFDKCLIATGGRPKNLQVFERSWDKLQDKVTLFRNVDDFNRLYSLAKQGKTIAIVGGGFLGSELACALSNLAKKYGGKVIQIYPESSNLRKVLPEYLGQWTKSRIEELGVSIIANTNVTSARLNDDKLELTVKNVAGDGPLSNWLLVDHAVVSVGLEANVQLAPGSGFEIDANLGGYVVNAELQARNAVWVAGDAACFYDIKLGRRRVEHHDHAVVSGRLAGENMTGAAKPYLHQSMFWSDLGPKIGFEAIGLVDSSLQTVGLFAKADEDDNPAKLVQETNESLRSDIPATKLAKLEETSPRTPSSRDDYGKGVIFYLKDDKIVGVLLWNVFKAIPIARQERLTDYKEMAKLFRINNFGLDESGN